MGGEAKWYHDLYTRLYENGYHRIADFDKHARPIVEHLLKWHWGWSVLDIGCARGWAIREMRGRGMKAVGIDASRLAVLYGMEVNAPILFGSATDLPFGDRAFDIVMHTDVFEHLKPEHVDQAVLESVRVCRHRIFAKICTRQHVARALIEQVGEDPRKLPGLHLTVQPIDWWIERYRLAGGRLISKPTWAQTGDTFVIGVD